jgi:DNA-binding transcriptional regulator LsrR (DeoR family)
MATIESRLIDAHSRVATCQAQMIDAKADLLAVVLEAHHDVGMTYQEIGQVLGVKRARVQQLVRQADGRGRSSR